MSKYMDLFDISGKVCVVTGGGGLIGMKHTEAILEGHGVPVLLDIVQYGMDRVVKTAKEEYGNQIQIETYTTDITSKSALEKVRDDLLEKYAHIDVLINNAANNPKVEGDSQNLAATQFCDFPVEIWNQDFAVGLTGAMLTSQVFGKVMESGLGKSDLVM